MAEIDNLSISIKASAESANKAIDSLIKNLGRLGSSLKLDTSKIENIGKNIDLSNVTKSTQNIQAQFENVGKSMEKSMKKVSDMTNAFSEKYKDLGKNFQFFGSEKNLDSEITKYSNALEKANLKKEELFSAGKTDSKMYEDAIKDVQKYTNILDSLKTKKAELYTQQTTQIFDDEAFNNLPSIKAQADQFQQLVTESFERAAESAREFTGAWDGIKIPQELLNNVEEAEKTVRGKIESIQEIFKDSGKDFTFEGNSEQLEKEIQKVNSELEGLYNKQDRMIELGKVDTSQFKEVIRDIENAVNRLEILENYRPEALNRTLEENAQRAKEVSLRMEQFKDSLSQLKVPEVREENLDKLNASFTKTQQKLEELKTRLQNGITMGKITESVDDSGFVKLQEQISLTEKQAEALKSKIIDVGNASGKVSSSIGFDRLKQSMSNIAANSKKLSGAFNGLYTTLNKLNNGINKLFSRFTKLFSSIKKTESANNKANLSFGGGLKTVLKYGLGIRSLYALFNKLRNAIKDGFKNLVQYSEEVNQSVSTLNSSLSQFKNATAAAFSPILNAVAPILNTLIQLFIKATNAINQFLSALIGSGTWIRAKYVYDDVAKSISGVGKAAKDVLLPIDELNINAGDIDGGGIGGTDVSDMFETLPVEDKFKELADKIKAIMEQLFAPLKEAWEREGKFVMDSWQKALKNVWELIKSIGRDFLEMWQQEATIKMFADILHIIGDIGLVISHIAYNLREAWEYNNTGLHILENIRDIFAAIVHNIRLVADYTVTWAKNLNFSPIMEAFERFTASLKPVMDNLSGVFTDFYTQVLLPLGKWGLEDGLPKLLDVFTAFNDKVDWERLRENLSKFWTHLEPFAEKVGEGLIIFIERISDLVSDFLNSDKFVEFLEKLENWMDNIEPDDIADGIEKLAKAIISLKVAVEALGAVKGLVPLANVLSKLAPLASTLIPIAGLIGEGLWVQTEKGAKSYLDTMEKLNKLDFKNFNFSDWKDTILGFAGATVGLDYSFFAQTTQMNNAFDIENMPKREDYETLEEYNIALAEWQAMLEELSQTRFEIQGVEYVDGWNENLVAIKDKFSNWWNEKFVPFWDESVVTWWDDNVEPWFTVEKWSELWENVKKGISNKWEEFTSWWENTGISNWWEENVAPWFSFDTWYELAQGIWDGILTKWEEFKEWWQETALFTWWEENVAPWFSAEKWTETANGIYTGVKTRLDETINYWKTAITNWWNTNVSPWFTKQKWEELLESIPEVFRQSFKNAANGAIEFLNDIIDAVESAVNSAIEALRKLAEAVSSIPGVNISFNISDVSFPRIPQFAQGGFPEDGWFRASKGEYFGQFDDGTSYVSNNTQIENGIAQGVEEAAYRGFVRAMSENTRETSLLEELIDAVREGKEITIDGRALVDAYDDRKERNGWSFA